MGINRPLNPLHPPSPQPEGVKEVFESFEVSNIK